MMIGPLPMIRTDLILVSFGILQSKSGLNEDAFWKRPAKLLENHYFENERI
jgi:hypothetical protein